MSYFINSTPVIEIVLENPLLSVKYPEEGCVLSVLDTGYEGFAMLPEEVFKELKLNELLLDKRKIIMPNGDIIESVGTYGKIVIPELNASKDGFIEASKGVDEIVLGGEFARDFRFVLDYCLNKFEIFVC